MSRPVHRCWMRRYSLRPTRRRSVPLQTPPSMSSSPDTSLIPDRVFRELHSWILFEIAQIDSRSTSGRTLHSIRIALSASSSTHETLEAVMSDGLGAGQGKGGDFGDRIIISTVGVEGFSTPSCIFLWLCFLCGAWFSDEE